MLNIACIMGRLTADPELRHTSNDKAVVKFTLACNRPTRADAESQADFIDITAWGKTAEFVSKYFHKGQLVAVDGSIRTDSYEKEGVKRKSFEIWANNVHFAEAKKSDAGNNSDSRNNNVSQERSRNSGYSQSTEGFDEIPTDDDLPF